MKRPPRAKVNEEDMVRFVTNTPLGAVGFVEGWRFARSPNIDSHLSQIARHWLEWQGHTLRSARAKEKPARRRGILKIFEIMTYLEQHKDQQVVDFITELAAAWCLLDRSPMVAERGQASAEKDVHRSEN